MSKQDIINRNGHKFAITVTGHYRDGSVEISVECLDEGTDYYREYDEVDYLGADDEACEWFYDMDEYLAGLKKSKVLDATGTWIDYEAAVNLMDDELREEIANSDEMDAVLSATNYEECQSSRQIFFQMYSYAHEKRFGEPFAPYAGLAW